MICPTSRLVGYVNSMEGKQLDTRVDGIAGKFVIAYDGIQKENEVVPIWEKTSYVGDDH